MLQFYTLQPNSDIFYLRTARKTVLLIIFAFNPIPALYSYTNSPLNTAAPACYLSHSIALYYHSTLLRLIFILTYPISHFHLLNSLFIINISTLLNYLFFKTLVLAPSNLAAISLTKNIFASNTIRLFFA